MRVLVSKPGQVSVEFLLLAGVLLLLVLILGGFSLFVFSDSSSSNQIQNSLRSLQTAVNHVNALGPGNSVVVLISLPSTVQRGFVGGLSGKELVLLATTQSGDQNFFVYTDANVFGSIPGSLGSYSVRVSSDYNGVSLQTLGG